MQHSVSAGLEQGWQCSDIRNDGDLVELINDAIDPTELYVQRLRLLRDLDRAILAARSTAEVARVALTGMQALVPYARASVTMFDFAADEIEVLAARRGSSVEGTEAGQESHLAAGARARLSSAELLRAASRGEPHIVPDLRQAHLADPWLDLLLADGVVSYTAIPLIAGEEVIGCLTLGQNRPGHPSLYALEMMGDIADSLALAVRQARLHEQVLRHSQELEAHVAARTRALQLSQARFRAIFDAAPIGMLLATREGRILESNPALQAMLGQDAAALQNFAFPTLTGIAKEDGRDAAQLAAQCAERFAAVLAGANPNLRLEVPYVRRDGQTVWTQVTVAPVTLPDEYELGVAMIEDVTGERATQAALMQAERLAITGRLGASLAHEINNPLQSIIGCLGLAEESVPDGSDATRYLDVARDELRRVARTVAQLRDVHGGGAAEQAEPVQLVDVVEQLLVLNGQRCAAQQVEVDWRPGHVPSIVAVKDGIRQVFLNLLLNALDAMPAGGTLTIATRQTAAPAGVEVTFRDTGHGIDAATLERVFEPFHTTKRQGLGLGLFTSRSIIERHGGTIRVASRSGHGAEFTLWLPLTREVEAHV